jgi:hypothetical protein
MGQKDNGHLLLFHPNENGRKFQLTVYRRKNDEKYMLGGREIDFTTCLTECIYRVRVDIDG